MNVLYVGERKGMSRSRPVRPMVGSSFLPSFLPSFPAPLGTFESEHELPGAICNGVIAFWKQHPPYNRGRKWPQAIYTQWVSKTRGPGCEAAFLLALHQSPPSDQEYVQYKKLAMTLLVTLYSARRKSPTSTARSTSTKNCLNM